MFTPRGTPRGRASPFTATPQGTRSAQSKRVANVFTPQRKGSPFVGKQSQANRSVLQASQLLEETSQFRIEKFGTPLPVLITEALTYADRNTKISVKTEPSGWAWLVGGRKLFVWRYKQGPAGRNVLCKELTLPPSDLAHSASRVCVIPSSGDHQSAACVAVSPEGVIRYWPNIAYEASSSEISAELKGEESDCVVNLAPYGCLLATTTSSLVLLTPVPGQNTITCHSLKSSHGMFAGFGRRMSSLIFGGGPGQATGAPLQAVVAGVHEEEERPFYVLSGTQMQKWIVGDYSVEKFLYQIDADRLFREALAKKVWDQDAIQMTQLTTWILDMQITRGGVVLLGAGVNPELEPVVRYAIAVIATDISGTPSNLESFTLLDFVKRYQDDNEVDILKYRLLYPYNRAEEIFLYDDYSVVMTTANGGSPDEIPAPGGKILGAGVCDGTAVFFSLTQGLISVSFTQKQDVSIFDEPTQELVSRGDVSSLMATSSQLHELSTSEDKSSRLKGAFLTACSGNIPQAQEIVDELFPATMFATRSQSTELDRLITHLSRDLIDDYPASDPRWAENARGESTSSTSSLIILQQLKDKQRAHDYIINFLKRLNLWEKLRTVMAGDHVTSTRLLLCQHAEQLEAAIVLREMHSDFSEVIDPAIRKVLSFRGEQTTATLAPQDIFFREVSNIHEIFEALQEFESDIMSGDFPPADIITVISSVNSVMEGMLHAALQYRLNKSSVYQAENQLEKEPEYIPWTSTTGNQGIRDLLRKQFFLTLQTAVSETKDIETRGGLFQQLLSLVDCILDGYSSQLASLAQNPEMTDRYTKLEEEFKQQKHTLISPFLEYEQYERAGSLGEKYCDFEALIKLCEATGNQERIQRYQQQFAYKGFSDFLFSWYMKEGKRGRLLSLPERQQTQLQSFLQKDEFGYLKWLHDIECKDFKSAHETLLELGRNEEQFLAKKKTLLSLSKLSALASEDFDEDMEANITGINEEQELILHQELLPAELVENRNMDTEHMRVLTPTELIELYICEENSTATEYDFKKALDLMQFIDTNDTVTDFGAIQTTIWCQALLRDRASWMQTPTGDPLEAVKDTIFCKTISLMADSEGTLSDCQTVWILTRTDILLVLICIQTVCKGHQQTTLVDWDPSSSLPNKNRLLSSPELGDLGKDKQLQYMVGAVYELLKSSF